MRNLWKEVLGLSVIGIGLGVSAPAQADSVGPYYAMPSWDQTLPAATRFIVLSNLAGEAVLDRETGLVWQKTLNPGTFLWANATLLCAILRTGGRQGWRLPSLHELGSLVDPANFNPALPTGHPFVNVQPIFYWSATTVADNPSEAWTQGFSGGVSTGVKAENFFPVWCVRGANNADQY